MADQIKPVIQINEGKVGIGTSTPTAILELSGIRENQLRLSSYDTTAAVDETIGGIEFYSNDAGNEGVKAKISAVSTDDTGSAYLSFFTGTGQEQMRISNTGGLTLDAYGAGYLKTDGNGAVTAESGIPGTGTFLPLAGGTMTGNITLPGEENNTFKIGFTGASATSGLSTVDQNGAGLYIGANSKLNNSGVVVYNNSALPSSGIYFDGWNGDDMEFYTGASGSPTKRLTISSTGDATFTEDARFNSRVRIGDVTGLSNRGTVRIDTRGDAPADLLFGRDTAGTATSWNNVYWSLSSRDSTEGNAFKIYRGTAHGSPYNSEAVALKFDPNLNATFSNLVTVGPGTTGSPYDVTTFLHVKGTTRSIVQQSSTNDAYYMFGDAAANNVAWLGYDHSSNQLSLHTSGTTSIDGNTTFTGSVTTVGNILTLARVGIGTTSPQAATRLDVRSFGGAGSIGIASYGYNGAGGRGLHGQGYATDNTVAGTSTGVYGIATGGRTIAGSINIGGYFAATGSVNNYALLTGGGNVGINNSTPTFSLDVVGTARVTGDTQFVTQSTTDDSTKVATTAFVKNILAEQPAGLTFLGDWNAATNSPALASGGGELASGSSTSLATNKLIDSAATFSSDGITVNTDRIRLVQANGNIEFVVITAVDSDTQLALASNAVTATGETYIVEASPFLSPEGGYYIVTTTGTTTLNGISDWTAGDWVLIATNNTFQKIDNTSILSGQGAEDKIAKWATSSGDPSVTLASSSITDTGSAVTIGNPTTITGPLTVNIDADSSLSVAGVGTNATAVFGSSGDELYVGGGMTYSVRYPSGNNFALFDNSNPGIAINTSNMNIGSAGPAADLTSFLNIVSTTAGVNPTLNISCDNVDEASIILSEESGNQGYGARIYYQGLGNNFFNIQIGDAGTWTNRFTIDRYGDVGIGILAPQGKMTVVGATQTVNMDLDANSAIGLSVMGVDSNNFNAFTIGSANSQNNAGVIRFKYNGAGSSNNYMGLGFYANDDILNVKANGTVGIGLTSPTNTDYGSVIPKLHVYTPGTSGAFDLVARFQAGDDSNDTGGAILINHSNDRGLLIEGGRGGDGATPDDDAVSHFGLVQSNGSHTRMMTLKQKNQSGTIYGVGIATELPQTKLQIGPLTGGDGSSQERLRLTGDYAGTNSGVLLRFTNQHDSGSNPNTGEYNLAGIIAYDYQSDWGGAMAFQTAPSTSGGGNLVTRMTIDQFGDIGIGTPNPDTKLHVIGNIRATGQTLYLSTSSAYNKIALNGTNMEIWSGALVPSIDITSAGLLKFGAYALGGAGTPTKLLGVDSSGNVLTTTNTGTVTSIATGGGLDGGTITTTGTIEVEYDGVPTNIIQSGFDFTGDTVVPGDYMMISDPGQTTTNRRIGYVTVGDLPKAPQTTFSRAGINSSTYTMIATVNGDNLASILKMTMTGTSGNVVFACAFDITVNHSQDIHVKSSNGDYTEVTLRITSNNNEDFSIEAKHNGSTTTTAEIVIFPLANEIITPTTTDPGYTGAEYIHTATEGWRFGGEDGNVESSRVAIDGALAIGTTFPTKPLTVNGTIRAEDNNSGDYIDITNDGSVSGHSKIETSNGNLILDPAGILDVQSNAVVKTSNGVGDFYIGNYATAKHFRFHTNNSQTYFDMNCGQINWREGSSTRYYFYPSTANMTINGTLTQNSDSRVKENVVEIDDCIGKVQAMKGVYYNRTDFNTDVTKVGVIAQDVEAVLPELILEAPDTGLKSVAYAELTAVLINAIKEQQEIIEDLKTRIIKLEK